jgi:hypothetical protein
MSARLVGPSIGGQILSPEFRSSGVPSGQRGFAIITTAVVLGCGRAHGSSSPSGSSPRHERVYADVHTAGSGRCNDGQRTLAITVVGTQRPAGPLSEEAAGHYLGSTIRSKSAADIYPRDSGCSAIPPSTRKTSVALFGTSNLVLLC